ncbi:MAG: nucleoside triphosphate pyrophosphohydrolase family protein [Lachnospiraceae bacterium]|nr:nucleoside triphosphate pyrophosphohydrolase family protein [Lachnospiraceae bacterium]
MTGNEYQKLAMRTCSIPYYKVTDRMFHSVFGLNAEAGEVASILQKEYQGHEFDPEHMMKELGDCLWMIAECATAMNVTLDSIMEMNIEKLKARYPDGFDAEHSLHRAEGDI